MDTNNVGISWDEGNVGVEICGWGESNDMW